MKLVKRIIYSLLGLLMVLTLGMVSLILYAEYSGKPFSFKSTSSLPETAYADDGSRLVAEAEAAQTDIAPVSEDLPAEAPESGNEPAQEPETAMETAPVPAAEAGTAAETSADDSASDTYALNTESSIFHKIDCPLVAEIAADHYTTMTGLKENVVARGYDPCGNCNP